MAWPLWEKALQLATLATVRDCAEIADEHFPASWGFDVAGAIRRKFGIEK